MRFSIAVVTAFAASAMASPAYQIIDKVEVVLVTVTEGTPRATAASNVYKPDTYQPPPPPPPQSQPPAVTQTQPPAPSNTYTTSSGNDVLDTFNLWRSTYNLSPLSWSSRLEQNAAYTGQMNGGSTETHHLDPNTNEAQIITPGKAQGQTFEGVSAFDLAMICWLCEQRSDPQLAGKCDLSSSYGMVYSDTGHHDIIVSPQYRTLGCAFTSNGNNNPGEQYQGLWVCTLSPDIM